MSFDFIDPMNRVRSDKTDEADLKRRAIRYEESRSGEGAGIILGLFALISLLIGAALLLIE